MAKLIYLDPGHGHSTAGKRSPDGTYREYEFNWDMCLKMKASLTRCGFNVAMTRNEPYTDTPLSTRVKLANNAGADLFMSFHSNAATNTSWANSARGMSMHIYTPNGIANNISKVITNSLFPVMTTTYGLKNRGIYDKNSYDLYIPRMTKMPAILFECAFHTAQDDVALLSSQAFRHALCENMTKGVCKYFGITYKSNNTKIPNYTKIGNVTNTDSLNVRASNSTSSSIIGTLNNTCKVFIVDSINGWCKIIYGSNVGYVSSAYITNIKNATGSVNNIIVENTSSSDVTSSVKITNVDRNGVVKSTTGLNVRKGPSANEGKIGAYEDGANVNITGVCSNGWYRVSYNGSIGYVHGSYVTNVIEVVTVDPIKKVCPYKIPSNTIKSGSTGTGVKWLQWHLNELINANLVIDGSCGPATVAALKIFQSKFDLAVDGSCGPATKAKIKELMM